MLTPAYSVSSRDTGAVGKNLGSSEARRKGLNVPASASVSRMEGWSST